MRCGDCKFWGVNVRERYSNGPVNQTGEWRQCGRLQMYDSYDADATKNELAVTEDGSDYHAALKSRADFGCVLFERKG